MLLESVDWNPTAPPCIKELRNHFGWDPVRVARKIAGRGICAAQSILNVQPSSSRELTFGKNPPPYTASCVKINQVGVAKVAAQL